MSDENSSTGRKRGRPRGGANEESAGIVQALDRGLVILSALAKEGSLSLSDLGMRVGVPPSSAYRLLLTMQKHGFVDFEERSQQWAVGLQAFRVGSAFVNRTNLVDVSRDTMRALTHETGETSNLAILNDQSIVVLHQIQTTHPIRAFFDTAKRVEVHSSGSGKAILSTYSPERVERLLQATGLMEFTPKTITSIDAMLADLKQTHSRGWAFDDEERYEGMRCVAAPIFNAAGQSVAGISVSGPTARLPKRRVEELGIIVRKAANEISLKLGG